MTQRGIEQSLDLGRHLGRLLSGGRNAQRDCRRSSLIVEEDHVDLRRVLILSSPTGRAWSTAERCLEEAAKTITDTQQHLTVEKEANLKERSLGSREQVFQPSPVVSPNSGESTGTWTEREGAHSWTESFASMGRRCEAVISRVLKWAVDDAANRERGQKKNSQSTFEGAECSLSELIERSEQKAQNYLEKTDGSENEAIYVCVLFSHGLFIDFMLRQLFR